MFLLGGVGGGVGFGVGGITLKPQAERELALTAKRLLLSVGLLVDQCESFSERWKELRGGEASSQMWQSSSRGVQEENRKDWK